MYQPSNVADGVIGVKDSGEWASDWEANPWIRLEFDRAYSVGSIVLYARNSETDVTKSVHITFSDGSSIDSKMPILGDKNKIEFSERKIEWVKIQITDGNGCPGFSEIEVLRTDLPSGDFDQLIPDYSCVGISYLDANSGARVADKASYWGIIGTDFSNYIKESAALRKIGLNKLFLRSVMPENTVLEKTRKEVKYYYVEVDGSKIDGGLIDEKLKQIYVGQSSAIKTSYSSIEWSSSNSDVASVDQNGTVTAYKPGVTIIAAKKGGKSEICIVTVRESY